MKHLLRAALFACVATLFCTGAAHAWLVQGEVTCAADGSGVDGVVVNISGSGFSASTTTSGGGGYVFYLPDNAACYTVSLELGAGQTPVDPASGSAQVCVSDAAREATQDFSIQTPGCTGEGLCWLTAGGAKFSSLTGTNLGDNGPDHSWGGNVYPGCSPTAGDGGNWNHIAHKLNLHFQGRSIVVERCGNVDGIPPGSDSPKTPFNFIEFHGVGTLKGIQGNKADYGTVYFWAHCEDRNEPGSSGTDDGDLKDRYFLKVYSNPSNPDGSVLLLVDVDGNPSTVDPVTITHGNMQIHITSCDSPELAAAIAAGSTTKVGGTKKTDLSNPGLEPAVDGGTTWGKLKVLYR